MLKKLLPLVIVAAVACPMFSGLMAPGLQAQIAPPAAMDSADGADMTTSLAADGSSAVSALMAGNVVGRRGSAFGRRIPASVFIP